jgi:23S rRNA (uracil1939-C5)-methyltransferase
MELEVEIERLGALGDGVAEGPGGPIFAPLALPGERVRIAVDPEGKRADLLEAAAGWNPRGRQLRSSV